MNMKFRDYIDVRDLSLAVHQRGPQCTIRRVQREHSGWRSITYKGQRYQVFGGVLVDLFIDLCNPIVHKVRFCHVCNRPS